MANKTMTIGHSTAANDGTDLVLNGNLETKEKIILKENENYGNTLPSTTGAVEGQIFFKIV